MQLVRNTTLHSPLSHKSSISGVELHPPVKVPEEYHRIPQWALLQNLSELTVRVALGRVRVPSVWYVCTYNEEIERPAANAGAPDAAIIPIDPLCVTALLGRGESTIQKPECLSLVSGVSAKVGLVSAHQS